MTDEEMELVASGLFSPRAISKERGGEILKGNEKK